MRYGDMMAAALTMAFCVWAALELRTERFGEAIAVLLLMLFVGAICFGGGKLLNRIADLDVWND